MVNGPVRFGFCPSPQHHFMPHYSQVSASLALCLQHPKSLPTLGLGTVGSSNKSVFPRLLRLSDTSSNIPFPKRLSLLFVQDSSHWFLIPGDLSVVEICIILCTILFSLDYSLYSYFSLPSFSLPPSLLPLSLPLSFPLFFLFRSVLTTLETPQG